MRKIKRSLLTLVALLTMTAGAWADDEPAPIDLTSTDGKEWTLATMPAYNVELDIAYYDVATMTTNPAAISGLTYSGQGLALVSAGETSEGTMMYALGENSEIAPTEGWGSDIPKGTDVNTYYVWYKVVGNDTHNDSEAASIAVSIGKATPDVTTVPTALELYYTGQPQALITAGVASAGTMQYSLDNKEWITDIPTATDEGNYTVYYKVVGNENYNDVPAATVAVTIGAAQPIELTSTDGKEWTLASMPAYNVELEVEYYPAATLTTAPTPIDAYATGSAQVLVTGGAVDGGSFEYALGNDATTAPSEGWTATVPTATAPATYYVWYKVVGDDTHSDSEDAPACLTAKISGFPVTIAANEYITYYSDMALTLEPSEQGTKLYTISEVGTETATATEIASANKEMPFLIYNGAANEKTVFLIPTTAEINQAVAPEFKGTLIATTIPASTATSNNYAFNGKEFVWVKNAIAVGANKAWLEIPTGAAAARALTIVFDDTTGLSEELRVKSEEFATATWYTLEGRKLQGVPTKKGVYIMNGKKVVVK